MRFTRRFLLPLATIVLAAVAVMFGGAWWLTNVQDRMAAQRDRQLVVAAVDAKVDLIQKLSQDYSFWDEAAKNLVLQLDRDWADSQIGRYLLTQYGHEHTYVIDRDGRPIYGLIDGRHSLAPPAETLGIGFVAGLKALTGAQNARAPIAGISRSPRGPVIFSIAPIRSDSGKIDLSRSPPRYLVMTKLISGPTLHELRTTTQLPSLNVHVAHATGVGDQPLRTFDGGDAGHLEWVPQHPGTTLFRLLLAPLIGLALAIGALAALVLRRARLGVRQIELSEAKALHLANRDSLTRLPNRRAFIRRLVRTTHQGEPYALLYMDLDGFKEVNDAFGHGTGDALLRTTAERLQKVVPDGAWLARLGGDEFAIVVDADRSDRALEVLAQEIIATIREVHDLAGRSVAIGASIGIARSEGLEYEDVVRRADVAMYAAKARGRDGWCLYDPSLDDGRQERKALEEDLRRALAEDQISVAFQPIVRAADGKTITVEALARWNHPEKGPIAPDVFIPVAEESGLIIELGEQVLRKACSAARDWPFKLAVNLSPAQFWDRRLVDTVTTVLKESGFAANRLDIEITETYLLRRPEAAEDVIAALQKLGIQVALDDFGTGYASIGYLRRFNLDFVKLDRSFVAGIAEDAEVQDVAMAVIALSTALKLPIVAEGVETAEDARILALAGCDYLQGWHFGRPVSAEEIGRQVAEGVRRGR